MELREMYGMFLHGESLDAMGTTEPHKKLIEVFELYNNVDALLLDIKHLNITKQRHDAGVEFCGAAPYRKLPPAKATAVINAIKAGQKIEDVAKSVGCSREWARKLLLKNGFIYDQTNKKWIQQTGYSIKSFDINKDKCHNSITLPCIAGDDKFEHLLRFLKLGATLKKASTLAGMSASHAGEKLKEMGYIHKNKKWYQEPITTVPTTPTDTVDPSTTL